ncbi:MAG TPA: winged helix-turn-helix domain-containing protein [Ktedonobacterales bacterium]|jgi:DNA-binding transcriptional ArsR family regulator
MTTSTTASTSTTTTSSTTTTTASLAHGLSHVHPALHAAATPPTAPNPETIPLLPESVPVAMPDLPPVMMLTTREQMKAVTEPTRSRILVIIQNQPATAKQIADRLGIPPGTIGHHLQVLENTGLARLIARRQVRGTVAKYYVRTARFICFDLPYDVARESPPDLDILRSAHDELADTIASGAQLPHETAGFPHARLSPARAAAYRARLERLMDEFGDEPPDPDGQIYSLVSALFLSPPYVQIDPSPAPRAPRQQSTSGK